MRDRAMNASLIGKTYGPFVYEAGAEKIREFAYAIGGGIPSMLYVHTPPDGTSREYLDAAYAAEQHGPGGIIAPPTFCVNFAMKPFLAGTLDPVLDLNLILLVHGEQAFEFPEPVRAGDVLTTVGKIAELYEKSGKEFLIMSTETRNQHGRVAVLGTWTAVIRKS
jgi:hypothetical protein